MGGNDGGSKVKSVLGFAKTSLELSVCGDNGGFLFNGTVEVCEFFIEVEAGEKGGDDDKFNYDNDVSADGNSPEDEFSKKSITELILWGEVDLLVSHGRKVDGKVFLERSIDKGERWCKEGFKIFWSWRFLRFAI